MNIAGRAAVVRASPISTTSPATASRGQLPAVQADQLMLVTDQAKMIRLPLTSLRVIRRGSAGVRLFNVADNEHVVSAVRLAESETEEEGGEEAAPEATAPEGEAGE
jgi:DNA gyrase subunit A